MIFIKLVLLSSFCCLVRSSKSFTSYQVVEIAGVKDFESEEGLFTTLGLPLDDEGLEVLHEDSIKGMVQILIKPDLQDKLHKGVKENQLKSHVLIEDVGALIEHSNSFRSEVFDLRGESTFDRYMKYTEISSYLRTLAMKFPHKMVLKNIGKSFDGIDIKMAVITEQLRKTSKKQKPVIFIEAGAHAREWISVSAAIYLIDQLARTTSLTKDVEWRIVPVTNPDGYKFSWNKDRLWRKNRKLFSDSHCFGVDLNRNFDSYWSKAGTSRSVCSTVYAGKSPFSEPESRAIRDAVLAVQNRTKAYVSLHNYGQLILTPPGVRFHKLSSQTDSMLEYVGKEMSNAIFNRTKFEYTVGSPAKMLYPASGLSMDWALLEAKIPLSFTLELRDTGTLGFLLPEAEIEDTVNEVWAAMKILYLESKKIKPNLLKKASTDQIWDTQELSSSPGVQKISLYHSNKEEGTRSEEIVLSDISFLSLRKKEDEDTTSSSTTDLTTTSSTIEEEIGDNSEPKNEVKVVILKTTELKRVKPQVQTTESSDMDSANSPTDILNTNNTIKISKEKESKEIANDVLKSETKKEDIESTSQWSNDPNTQKNHKILSLKIS